LVTVRDTELERIIAGMDSNELRIEEVSVGLELDAIESLRLRLSNWRRAADLGEDGPSEVPPSRREHLECLADEILASSSNLGPVLPHALDNPTGDSQGFRSCPSNTSD
jgi:hypothetical protein